MSLLFPAGYQFLNSNARALASGTLTFYETETTTPKAVYSDIDMSVEVANPYSLDASGRIAVNLYSSGLYTILAKTSAGVTVWSRDDVFGWTQNSPGDVTAYGAIGDGSTDDTAAIAAAITAAGVGGKVCFPKGTYAISAALVPLAGQTFCGDGRDSKIEQTAATTDIFNCAVSGVTWHDLHLVGNGDLAKGIDLDGSSGSPIELFTIERCWFSAIGAAATAACCINGDYASKIRVAGCFFLSDCESGTGADIALNNRCTDVIVEGNHSVSKMDSFASFSAVSTLDTDLVRHTVTGNIVNRTNEAARSAVIATYDSHAAHVAITGNVFEGFVWNGVYIQGANADATALESGGITVSNNIIRWCGGESAGISAGIYVAGTAGATVTGNLVYGTGTTPAGVDRTEDVSGIKVFQNSKAITVSGNSITAATAYGISVNGSGTQNISGVAIVGNAIKACDLGSVHINVSAVDIHGVVISGNTMTSTVDANGIRCATTASGTITDIRIDNNFIECTNGSPTFDGIGFTDDCTGEVVGNTIIGFDIGVVCVGASARFFPDKVRLESNRIKDCAYGISVTGGLHQIAFGTIFESVTTELNTGVYAGRMLGTDASGVTLVEVISSAAPASGAWAAGDSFRDVTPSASGWIGGVCVTAGSPGTWKSYGAIDA